MIVMCIVLFRTAKCPTLTLYPGLRPAVWRGRTHLCTVSVGNQTSTASWCKFTTPGLFQLLDQCEWIQWCSLIIFFYLFLPLTVAVIIVMSGSTAIALTSQRRRQRQFGNGTAWDAEVMGKIFFFFFFITAFKTVILNIKYITNHQNKWAIVALFSLSPDKDSSLEIKYRSKKNREKDPDSERTEKQYSTPSTPDYKSERRRGSKVSYTSDLII